jgi:hypothetical protein
MFKKHIKKTTMKYECKENDALIELGCNKDELLISIQGETAKTVIGLNDLHQALNIFGVSIMLPIKATHKFFGDVEIIGIRTECSSNNNKMYMVKNDGEYFWVYDYETELKLTIG